MRLIVTMLLLAASAFGQNAVVVPTIEVDAANLRRLNKELQSAQKALDEAKREIEEKYLLTEEVDLSSGHQAHRKGEDGTGTWASTGTSSAWISTNISTDASTFTQSVSACPTAEQIAKREASRKKQLADAAAYEKAHPWLYWRKGFDDNRSYEFSEDYRFIVPKPAPPPQNSFWIHPTDELKLDVPRGLIYK
jgi:hypothetical protein